MPAALLLSIALSCAADLPQLPPYRGYSDGRPPVVVMPTDGVARWSYNSLPAVGYVPPPPRDRRWPASEPWPPTAGWHGALTTDAGLDWLERVLGDAAVGR